MVFGTGGTTSEYQILAAVRSPEAEAKRKLIEQRRFWQRRAFEKAEGEARFLCQRLISLESRLGALVRSIRGHL